MIQIKNLTKSIYDQKIVDDLSLTIKEGTIFGFLGPNGAGKTTTMKMIVGLNSPDSGSIEIGGNDPRDIKTRQKIGYMPEDPYFYEHLSAMEFLTFMLNLFPSPPPSPRKRGEGERERTSLNRSERARKGSPHDALSLVKGEGQGEGLLKLVGLKDVGKKRIKDFSKGMKQRLGLAQALVNDPQYLFLDEPLDGLDPIGRVEFKRIFLDLKRRKKTVFFNSHILSDIEEVCDKIGIINGGKLVYAGPVGSFCKNTTLEKKFIETISKKE